MGSKVQHRMGAEVFAQPAVKGAEGMGRCEALLEQQAHRIALVAEAGLDPDEDLSKLGTQYEEGATVGLLSAGCRPPSCLDILQPRFAADVIVDRNTHRDVCVGAMLLGIALQQVCTKRLLGLREFDVVALVPHGAQRGIEGGEDVEIGGRAGCPAIRRKVEEHDRNLALGNPSFTQGHQFGDAGCQGLRPVVANVHILGAGCFEAAMTMAALTEFA